MSLSARLRLLALGSAVALAACATGCASDHSEDDGDSTDSAFTGTPNKDIGQFFMIEHYGVVPAGYPDVQSWVKTKNLGALILWNPTNASGEVVREMSLAYAKTAHAAGTDELFIAADQEEAGTQRFKAAHGFTNLVAGDELGAVAAKNGNARVCELHGEIMAKEMASAGMNMTLGTVSDIYTRTSGTPGMFRTRAVSSDSKVVSECINAMATQYGDFGKVVFVTKHFPGLGDASGNTDVDPSVHTESNTVALMENELAPYRATIASVNQANTSPFFGSMVSHASYPILDSSNSPATLSSQILTTLYRSPAGTPLTGGKDKLAAPASIPGMGFKGVTVSDAFWTWGLTQHTTQNDRNRLMARSFLAGMDILMIAKTDFTGAWDYFQQIYAGQLPAAEQTALAQAAGFANFGALQTKFKARVAESAQRIHMSKAAVGPVSEMVGTGPASNAAKDLVAEYTRLTQ